MAEKKSTKVSCICAVCKKEFVRPRYRSSSRTYCSPECYRKQRPVKHGGSHSAEYRIWQAIRQRCSNPNNDRFADYGGRGVIVCERWDLSFDHFISDMGKRPSQKHSIDRINNDGNYEPGNCRWATKTEQSENKRTNRRITFNGETLPISAWVRKLKISRSMLVRRLNDGWPVEVALTRVQHMENGNTCDK